MTQLVRFDTNALNQLNRAMVGFDRFFDDFEHRFANQIQNNYPPHNIAKYDEDTYEIQIAVSGFDKDELTVELDQNNLIIKGEHVDSQPDNLEYIHRGLAARDFTKSFALAEHIEVGDVRIKNGILYIQLKRIVPESLKPRVLKIKAE
jgi:molecular chaperone IbpA